VRWQRWIPALWFVAAALALSAAVIKYLRTGEFELGITAAGVFLLAMRLGQLKKTTRRAAGARVPAGALKAARSAAALSLVIG
jgi:hypothetical protein